MDTQLMPDAALIAADASLEDRISRRLEGWGQMLLDLSKRNRLLYFNPGVGSKVRAPHGVKLSEPEVDVLWDRLACKGKKQEFLHLESELEILQDEDEEGESDDDESVPISTRPLKRDEIRAEPEGVRLGRLLTNLRSRARTSFEEQGIVTLFAAFGFLRWKEEGHEVYSPLLLVPVELVRSSPSEPYQLRRHEEEVLLNPALKWKLESDFKVSLPEAPSLDAQSLAPFFAQVCNAISKHQAAGWGVVDWAYLGLFSFHKIAMFRDLRDNRALLMAHPAVRALGGDAGTQLNPVVSVPSGAALDDISHDEMELIVDADSSQHEAILAARAGLSFVLQGPPGTGKSQTITNIIAECLETGKKVLFVSEKMAALEVVHNRLKAAGLGDFCLEAHSHKANKKAVVEELGRTLKLARLPAVGASDDDIDLPRLRDALTAYVRTLHAPHPTSHLSPHAAMGHLTQQTQAPDLEFAFANPGSVSPTTRAHLHQWLQELERSYAILEANESHPWRGVTLRESSLQTTGAIRAQSRAALTALDELEASWETFRAAFEARLFGSLHGVERLLELARIVEQGAHLPLGAASQWLQSRDIEPLRVLAREQGERARHLTQREAAFAQNWTPATFNLPHEELRARLEAPAAWLERAGGPDAALKKRADLESHLNGTANLDEVMRDGQALSTTLGVSPPTSLAQSIELLKLSRLFEQRPRPRPAWFEEGGLLRQQSRLEEARKSGAERRAIETDLATRWKLDALLSLPCGDLAEKFAGQYSGFVARLGGAYKADRARLNSARLDNAPLEANVTPDLQAACRLKALKENAQQEAENDARDFGAHFDGERTDWDELARALQLCRDIMHNRDGDVPPGLISALCANSSAKVEIAQEQSRELERALGTLHKALKALSEVLPLRGFPFSTLPLQHAPLDGLHDWLSEGRAAFAAFFAALDTLDAGCVHDAPLFAARLTALDEAQQIARERQAWATSGDNLRTAFGPLFQNQNTNWDTILQTLEWSDRVLGWFGTNPIADGFFNLLSDAAKRGTALQRAGEMRALMTRLESPMQAAESWFPSWQVNGRPPEYAAFAPTRAWFEAKMEHLEELDDWLRFQTLGERALELGLSRPDSGDGFWERVQAIPPPETELQPAFWKRFWTLWLDDVTLDAPLLRGFSGLSHELLIERFARLDTQNQEQARERLRALLSNRKPIVSLNAPRSGQIAMLQREVVKKTRHLPLRQLFEGTGELLQALKPCILMSPLSVAQFLPAGKVQFDVVVFDEASQICPEDAIGAIARAKQLIVVGDNKQLPPTRFFGSTHDNEDDGDGDEGAIIESILDDCGAAGLPSKMLRWHYRSRHEELIAFSNAHFYENDLMTFPGPFALDAVDGAGRALEWERVQGIYQPGGRGAGRDANTNRIEARRVAELAVEHARQNPEQSLGIITFNEAQKRAVEEAIVRLSASDRGLDSFFNARGDDAFFVKNLENVQGDERDVILFSVGFGPQKDAEGNEKQMSLNFGPLSREGGERRLNVAVTRARVRVKIVTSFDPLEIDPARTKSRGAHLLRNYLEFARTGAEALPLKPTSAGLSDPIALAVMQALQEQGLQVRHGVGLAEFRVDVAVEDSQQPGKLILGIACDGLNYCGAATARDRDRLRPQVLKLLGWHLHRIWSPDWIKNPAREIQKVLQSLEAAQQAAAQATIAVVAEAEPLDSTQIISDPPESFQMDALAQTVFASWDDEEEIVVVDEEEKPEEAVANAFVAAQLERRGSADDFYILAETNRAPILQALLEVVAVEGPMSVTVATRRVVKAWDMSKAGGRLVGIIGDVAGKAARQEMLQKRGDWLWPMGMERPLPRPPQPDSEPRPIEEIAPEEIVEAALIVVQSAFALDRDALIVQIARFFGFKQTGVKVRAAIQAALPLLEEDSRLRVQDGQFVCAA